MAILIEDGRGSGYRAQVNHENKLETSARTTDRIYYNSRDYGQAFAFTSSYSATSGDYVLYIKNISKTKRLVIQDLKCSGEAGRATFKLNAVTGTASGTSATAINFNLTSANQADCTFLANGAVSGLTSAGTLEILSATDDSTVSNQYRGSIILGLNSAIAVLFTGTSGNVNVSMAAFFEDIL